MGFCFLGAGVLAFGRDAARMSDRLAIALARQSMARNTGSKVAWSQWVVDSWCEFECGISGLGMVLGDHVVVKGGRPVVSIVVVIIGKSLSSLAAAVASLAVGCFEWCILGSLVRLLMCVGIGGVGKNGTSDGIIIRKLSA